MIQFLFPMDGTKPYQLNPTEEECEEVIKNFKAAIHGIESCEFEPKIDKTNCERCQYRSFCQQNIV